MSAPTPNGGDGGPAPGYYPDPSIPGYVRYWNGAAWVPGTSRPAPQETPAESGDGAPAAPAAQSRPAVPAAESGGARASGARVPESRTSGTAAAAARTPVTGAATPASPASQGTAAPAPAAVPRSPAPAASPAPPPPAPAVEETGPVFLDEDPEPAPAPEPASAWQADSARQSGFGGERDSRVAWGSGEAARTAPAADPQAAAPASAQAPGAADPSGGALPGVRTPAARQEAGPAAGPVSPQPAARAGAAPESAARKDDTVTIRALRDRVAAGRGDQGDHGAAPGPDLSVRSMTPGAPPVASPPHPGPARQPQPQVPQQSQAVPRDVRTQGPGGGSASWAQQAHRLGGTGGAGEQPAPWKPVAEDPFLRAAQAQAAARPASLVRRLAARLVDTAVLGVLTAAVAVPFVSRAIDHVDGKIEAAKQSGRTVTVWLLDGTTGMQLAVVLGALLVLGVLYEALPTAKWGRTFGKMVCGIRVVDIESHEPPSVGTALRRWGVYTLLGLFVVGVANVVWCLFDRPWRQCWHDKLAHTFVTGRPAS
jgi:uncharacterized RDD family membrane protein YckC